MCHARVTCINFAANNSTNCAIYSHERLIVKKGGIVLNLSYVITAILMSFYIAVPCKCESDLSSKEY